MKKAVILLLVLMILPLTLCGCKRKKEKEVVIYDDMEKAFETSGLISANIGIFTKTVSADSISYGECGGGVFNEDMKLTGTITGAMISPDGTSFISGYMIPISEIKACLKEWK